MKTMVVTLSEKEETFFLELLKRFNFKSRELTDSEVLIEIPDAHKTIVRRRIKNTKLNEMLDWDKVKNNFKLD